MLQQQYNIHAAEPMNTVTPLRREVTNLKALNYSRTESAIKVTLILQGRIYIGIPKAIRPCSMKWSHSSLLTIF